MHHIIHVSDGGGNTQDNLIALCPTCHGLHHRGEIPDQAIRVWKGMLVTLNRAFDKDAIDLLLFLHLPDRPREYTSESVLRFANLITSGLVTTGRIPETRGGIRVASYAGADYFIELTDAGRLVVEAWIEGDKVALASALASRATIKTDAT